MTVAELMHHNFDEIFIELDPVKREAMIRNAYKEDCVWIHPGGRLVGIAAINEAASEIRKRIPEYRYKVIGDIRTMHNVGMCRWGSGRKFQNCKGREFPCVACDLTETRYLREVLRHYALATASRLRCRYRFTNAKLAHSR